MPPVCRPTFRALSTVLGLLMLFLPGLGSAPLRAELFAYRAQVLYPAVVLDGETAYREFGSSVAAGDFDGDGDDDLAVGTPATDFTPTGNPAILEAGSVQVYTASGSSFAQLTRRQLTQEDFGVAVEEFDHFGEVLAAGDFDGDGRDDLAIGIPGENIQGPPVLLDAGMVQVIYGGELGLDTDRTATALLSTLGVTPADNENFGAALATGDFDGDGFDDLAIGVPGRDVGALDHAGWAFVVYGSGTGLVWADHEALHQDVTGVLGTAAANERFGAALAAGNFGGAGPDDLAIGAPDDTATGPAAGTIHILYGSAAGLLPADGDQLWHQNVVGVDGDAEAGDQFGAALAAGDFDGDDLVDLAIGVPGQDVTVGPTTVGNAGQVHFFYGVAGGFLGSTGNSATSHPCACGCPQSQSFFGEVLAAGDLDGSGLDALVVGQPREDAGAANSGSLCLRLGPGRFQLVLQNLPGVPLGNEAGDRFGNAVAIGGQGGRRYVATGIPFEEVPGSPADQGRVLVLYDALFADGFQSGDLTVWSSAVP